MSDGAKRVFPLAAMFVRLNESGVRVVYKAKVTRLNHYTFDIERKSALARIIHTNNGRLT